MPRSARRARYASATLSTFNSLRAMPRSRHSISAESITPGRLVKTAPGGSSEEIQEFGSAEAGLPQNGGKGTGRKIAPMHRYDRLTGGIVAMPQKMMRSLAADDLESSPLQRRDNATARQRWKRSHALDSATGTNWSIGEVRSRSGDGRALPSSSITSRHSSIASRALAC